MTHPGVEMISTFMSESGMTTGTVAERRSALDQMAEGSPPPERVSIDAITLGGRDAERITPDGGSSGTVVLYLHGGRLLQRVAQQPPPTGAHASPSPRAARWLSSTTALPPSIPFRLPCHDATSAYRELVGSGVPPSLMAIAGDSAGGGLTMAALLALRAAGDPLPAAAVCLSPWVDLTQSSPAYDALGPRRSHGDSVWVGRDGPVLPREQ